MINSTTNTVFYSGNGSTVDFSYTPRLMSNSHIKVYVNGAQVNSGWAFNSSNSVVTFNSAPSNGTDNVVITRDTSPVQTTQYPEGTKFPTETVERDLDYRAVVEQDLAEDRDRSIRLHPAYATGAEDLRISATPNSRAGRAIIFSSDGLGIETGALIENIEDAQQYAVDAQTAATEAAASAAAAAASAAESETAASLIDAKGDLLAGTAADTLGRVAVGADGTILVADSTATPGVSWSQAAFQPNPIINGGMDVWQRGTSFAAIASAAFGPDRWAISYNTTGVVTLRQSSLVPPIAVGQRIYANSLEVDVTTADASLGATDYMVLLQRIEGYNWGPFAQKTITVSFSVYSTKTGVHCVALQNGSGDLCCVKEYTIAQSGIWEYHSVTFPASPSAGTWNYSSGSGAILVFTLAAGSGSQATAGSWASGDDFATSSQVNCLDSTSNYFGLVGVQIDVGSAPLAPRYIPYEVELQRCKRYYQKSFLLGTAPVQNAGLNTGEHVILSSVAGITAFFRSNHVRFSPPMKSAPTITLYNPRASNAQIRNTITDTDCTFSNTANITDCGFNLTGIAPADTAVGDPMVAHWTAVAEV